MRNLLNVTNHRKGLWAEWWVRWYLRLCGYGILAKRYKTKFGEIDLICSKKGWLIFVEVKAYKDKRHSLEAVTQKTQKRIIKASQIFVQQYQKPVKGIRFDVAAVTTRGMVMHIRNAFTADL